MENDVGPEFWYAILVVAFIVYYAVYITKIAVQDFNTKGELLCALIPFWLFFKMFVTAWKNL